jgi:hypothetical protein
MNKSTQKFHLLKSIIINLIPLLHSTPMLSEWEKLSQIDQLFSTKIFS